MWKYEQAALRALRRWLRDWRLHLARQGPSRVAQVKPARIVKGYCETSSEYPQDGEFPSWCPLAVTA